MLFNIFLKVKSASLELRHTFVRIQKYAKTSFAENSLLCISCKFVQACSAPLYCKRGSGRKELAGAHLLFLSTRHLMSFTSPLQPLGENKYYLNRQTIYGEKEYLFAQWL